MRRLDRVERAVVAVTAIALVVRLVGLGARPFHWDEARVGYWTLRSLETGAYEYRPVAGGPFLYVVGRRLFALGLTGDAAARLPVALIGGLLPLAALLFRRVRDRASRSGLSDTETVALALLLALAPPLLYYSRVLRGDLPLAAFSLVAVGFAWRARRRERRRALYAGAAAFGLALATSGFAPAVVGCWLVAGLLTIDEGRVRGADPTAIRARVRAGLDAVADRSVALLRAVVVTVAVAIAFYLPRGRVDLAEPASLLAALEAGTTGAGRRFLAVRVLGRHAPPTYTNDHALLPFVAGTTDVLLAAALPVVGLAVWGFFRARYAGRSRPLVNFAAYWAGAGLLLFPMATEVNQPWVAVHVLAPATVPAAVGLGALWNAARESLADDRAARLAAALLLLSAAGVHTGAVVAGEVYDAPEAGDALPGYAQPGSEFRAPVAAIERAVTDGEGIDVLYVGADLAVADESALDRPPVPESARDAFSARLPLAWYVERTGAETASVDAPSAVGESPPSVVVTTPEHRRAVGDRLSGYERYEVEQGLTNRRLVVFVAS
ncbi:MULTISPECIES: flippase activity-associated protein Agl23 [Halolamina]|uniref:TIGR03663 family protein n=1 Tax=Halolamina pelagica TaxID=699431 RepID=A0A1I5QV61_9EURY|nr:MULTISPECIES: flippase activity-associated protein Agl23 [Halolamina]NHX35549.1 TIGR03663 family protein [Halolamina sp. R1-12]SFP49921.1 TIGR03663 family protein [Halolamina pelagica]